MFRRLVFFSLFSVLIGCASREPTVPPELRDDVAWTSHVVRRSGVEGKADIVGKTVFVSRNQKWFFLRVEEGRAFAANFDGIRYGSTAPPGDLDLEKLDPRVQLRKLYENLKTAEDLGLKKGEGRESRHFLADWERLELEFWSDAATDDPVRLLLRSQGVTVVDERYAELDESLIRPELFEVSYLDGYAKGQAPDPTVVQPK
ncbi:MAG: hypothetical protein AAF488_19195 [Planctomycetota bacterium]